MELTLILNIQVYILHNQDLIYYLKLTLINNQEDLIKQIEFFLSMLPYHHFKYLQLHHLNYHILIVFINISLIFFILIIL
jgi:hypothetical protein